MKRIIQSLLFVGITAILTQFAFSQVKPKAPKKEVSLYQGRVWTSNDGKKVTARAVARTEDKVTLRMTDGKRVQVAIDQLSKEDSEWLANWIQPTFKVSAVMMEVSPDYPNIPKRNPKNPIKKRLFYIGDLEIYEDEIRDMIATLQEFNELVSKPLTDVNSYNKKIHTSKYNRFLVNFGGNSCGNSLGYQALAYAKHRILPSDYWIGVPLEC